MKVLLLCLLCIMTPKQSPKAWRHRLLREGLPDKQVLRILGEPVCKLVKSGSAIWFYQDAPKYVIKDKKPMVQIPKLGTITFSNISFVHGPRAGGAEYTGPVKE